VAGAGLLACLTAIFHGGKGHWILTSQCWGERQISDEGKKKGSYHRVRSTKTNVYFVFEKMLRAMFWELDHQRYPSGNARVGVFTVEKGTRLPSCVSCAPALRLSCCQGRSCTIVLLVPIGSGCKSKQLFIYPWVTRRTSSLVCGRVCYKSSELGYRNEALKLENEELPPFGERALGLHI